eukprot:GHVR01112819.1.p1 GENE.GHVR01112819.1~~GHVR01112819.1.p1  ORF type:complete len:186 (+),score=34.72 GHVR01112819.1:32-559(+)
MKTVGKHFPGHGFVSDDSHIDKPIDTRNMQELVKDFAVFSQVNVDAIMPAHIVFPEVDKKPACFSSIWLKNILKKKLKFKGCVLSDDLSMQGALFFENINDRVNEALGNGCDMVLICNNEKLVDEVLINKKNYSTVDKLESMKLNVEKFNSASVEDKKIEIKEFLKWSNHLKKDY